MKSLSLFAIVVMTTGLLSNSPATLARPSCPRQPPALAVGGMDSEPEAQVDIHGTFPELRPGADPSNPQSYAFLPSGVAKPPSRVRYEDPIAYGANLAAHHPYVVRSDFPDAFWHAAEGAYPDHGQLTDGHLGTLRFTDPAWVGYQYQYVRNITVDLQHPAAVRACSLDFLQDLGAGIVFPDEVRFLGSRDGVHWAPIGLAHHQSDDADFRQQTHAFEIAQAGVNARYVRAEFANKVWAFVDEFAVYGSPGINPHLPLPTGKITDVPLRGYAHAHSVGAAGIHNAVLVYTKGHGRLGTWTRTDFLPLVASRSLGHTPRPLFDTILFTPYRLPTTQSAWQGWLDDLFAPDRQLQALDQALDGQVSTWPKWRRIVPFRRRERVVITIPTMRDDLAPQFAAALEQADRAHTRWAHAPSVRAASGRRAIVAWYLNQVQLRWQRAHFRNLRLVGMAWQPESLSVVHPWDRDVVRATAALVHAYGWRFLWIPFYGAVGLPEWRRLGFDVAMVQPNVSFHWNMDAQARLAEVARFARRYGTGLEMEAHWNVTSRYPQLADTAQQRYFAYFAAGRTLGFQDSDVVKGWYLNSKTLLSAYFSPLPLYRRVYDCTARFIHGQPCDE